MASACVNVGMSPEKFPPASCHPSYGWMSPRVSLSGEDKNHPSFDLAEKQQSQTAGLVEVQDPGDFEFRLEDPVAMLPADELFSDGKFVPLKFTGSKQPAANASSTETARSPETGKSYRRLEMEISSVNPYVFSPKAPRCTTRWRELLGLKKISFQNPKPNDSSLKTTPSSSSSPSSNTKTSPSKHFLQRSSKSSVSTSSWGSLSSDASTLNLPLLKELDISESLSISSSRLSLSSSSSCHEHEDLPRLSLDSEKPSANPFAPARSLGLNPNAPKTRLVKPRPYAERAPARRRVAVVEQSAGAVVESRGVSVESPRLNSSGKIVFHSLERSSSSPSSFNGRPRFKHRGMERSYSANARVKPVLNVPVCSLRGSSKSGVFSQLFSSSSSSPSSSSRQKSGTGGNRGQPQRSNGKNRTDQT